MYVNSLEDKISKPMIPVENDENDENEENEDNKENFVHARFPQKLEDSGNNVTRIICEALKGVIARNARFNSPCTIRL
jgi:hypothetical protein